MNNSLDHFEILSIERLSQLIRSAGVEPRFIELDLDRVPPAIRPLKNYASLWGAYPEEGERCSIVEQVDDQFRKNLVTLCRQYEKAAMDWLVSEADSEVCEEYVAYSCLFMAADYAEVLDKL